MANRFALRSKGGKFFAFEKAKQPVFYLSNIKAINTPCSF